jgi:addiction module RelB/DinJ family antitoxin
MNTVIHIKADKEVKENAQKLARDLGLSLSDVINASLRNFLRTREVTFSFIPRMTPEFERLLGPIEKDIKNGRNLSGPFTSQKEIEEYLDSL